MISFIPFPTIMALHIFSYRAIHTSAKQFNLDQQRIRTMKQIRKTFFTVVIVFFVLTVPTDIYYIVYGYIATFYPGIFSKNYSLFNKMGIFFTLANSFNSCANPFVYAKIHRRFPRCTFDVCNVKYCIKRKSVNLRGLKKGPCKESDQILNPNRRGTEMIIIETNDTRPLSSEGSW